MSFSCMLNFLLLGSSESVRAMPIGHGGKQMMPPIHWLQLDQADSLGRDWADARIDHLLSSPLQRALDTAKALSSHNEGHPEIVINPTLVERRYGGKVHRLMQWSHQAAQKELRGASSSYDYGPPSRSHCPAEGGESMNMVANRAEAIILLILSTYAVHLSEAPESFLEKETADTPAVLPDGIPHVVIVSHNVFLMELYEKLRSWGRTHSETDCHWKNAAWWEIWVVNGSDTNKCFTRSRHILWYNKYSDTLDIVDMKFCGENDR